MAAGVALQRMRRHVRLGRLGVWGALASGPLALLVAMMPSPTAVQAAVPLPTPSSAHSSQADPAGYAEVFLSAWLRSDTGDDSTAQARLARSMAPSVALPEPAKAAQPGLEEVRTVRSAQRADGSWSVTAAAQYADGLVRYYAVPVVGDHAGSSFAVTGAPGVVAGPARAEVPRSSYGVTVPDGDLSSAVGEFLAAYLTGVGDVGRYLAPGVELSVATPAPYATVTVQQVLAVEEAAAAGQVPADGTKVHVLAQTEARDGNGRWPLAYELALKARSGRWEVAALESGTDQDGGVRS
jgi:hypothetical protein